MEPYKIMKHETKLNRNEIKFKLCYINLGIYTKR